MKKISLLLSGLFLSLFAFGQLNMSLVSQVQYQQDLNDVWGWSDPVTGVEYAIVGTQTGTSIVSLEDPTNATEVKFIPGPQSTWRDIKAWGYHVYVTNETSNGLLVIDMTGHPNNITSYEWEPILEDISGDTKQLESCHNLYIDEFGWCYLTGCNFNNGGIMFIDVFSNPGFPEFIGYGAPVYSHDVFTRDNLLYASEIYGGNLTIYDVTDKLNVQTLASQQTPSEFTHNAWLSDDSEVVFTTDEVANAPVAAYDISDLSDIKELDQYKPIETLGDGVIPHNVHVWQDWLIISYYSDGGIIVDASKPDNLIEVGNFDTFFGGGAGFNGAWGAYPFLPSGLVLVSDIGDGLYVLDANYVRACWLEGTVTNSQTMAPISGASITINSPQANLGSTDIGGKYQTGQAIPGTFDVLFEAAGFLSKTVPAVLDNGVLTILDVELDPLPNIDLKGKVVRSSDGNPIPNARVFVNSLSDSGDFSAVSDANGDFSVPGVVLGDYEVVAGAWGYKSVQMANMVIDLTTTDFIIELDAGYRDEFLLDLGWDTQSSASTGDWELGEPIGTGGGGGGPFNPDNDIPDDLGDWCYVTGNGGGNAGNDDIDNGVVTLTSPSMNLTTYNEPILNYRSWFRNAGGQGGPPDDALEVRISNGIDEVVVEVITESQPIWRPSPEIIISEYIAITNDMKVIFESSDFQGSGHLVEAAVDVFEIEEGSAYPPFQVSSTEGCIPFSVDFIDNSDTTVGYLWTFEGGTPATSTEANPMVVWNTPGNFDVSLTVETESGSFFTIDRPQYITVRGLPLSNFDFNVTGADVDFTSTSDDADSFSWDFGDSNGSSEENPSHTYTAAGSYTVTLTVTNPCASHVFTQVVEIDAVPPSAGFSASNTVGCTPFTIEFSDESLGVPTSWLWTFPGGTPEVSTEQNPVIVFNTPGVYSASLEVTNSAGNSEMSQSQFIVVEATPSADFDYSEDMGVITFTNLSQFGDEYTWTFGDNNSSSEIAPIHTYTANGDYEVTLSVTNGCGTVGFTQIISVSGITSVNELDKGLYELNASPNPFSTVLNIEYQIENAYNDANILIFNILGQKIESISLDNKTGNLNVLSNQPSGIFFIRMDVDGKLSEAIKVVKSN
ncbi:choice-of-anchor B family protein [Saprospiraceae bacterium]|jgi:choice-of-anchor B domain-containing protein|nr:choice-of-anchor B family protein [Bacteroidota bacterium]MDB4728374.1 choice-of-anchor B family protein [Saprospiraceae bacterium]MDF1867104.1 choice-of-anchor B family protein [Saprospiraceae bacterium]